MFNINVGLANFILIWCNGGVADEAEPFTLMLVWTPFEYCSVIIKMKIKSFYYNKLSSEFTFCSQWHTENHSFSPIHLHIVVFHNLSNVASRWNIQIDQTIVMCVTDSHMEVRIQNMSHLFMVQQCACSISWTQKFLAHICVFPRYDSCPSMPQIFAYLTLILTARPIGDTRLQYSMCNQVNVMLGNLKKKVHLKTCAPANRLRCRGASLQCHVAHIPASFSPLIVNLQREWLRVTSGCALCAWHAELRSDVGESDRIGGSSWTMGVWRRRTKPNSQRETLLLFLFF